MGSNVPSRFDGLGAEPASSGGLGHVLPLMSDIGPEANRLQRGQSGAPRRTGPRSIGALDLAERAGAIPHERRPTSASASPAATPAPNPPGGAPPRPKTRPQKQPPSFSPKNSVN